MEHQETCRTCLKPNENNCNIFKNIKNDKLISELIMECVPVTIQRDDKLPVGICNTCLEKLNYVLDFREMVLKSNETLSQRPTDEKKMKTSESNDITIKEEFEVDDIKDESLEPPIVESSFLTDVDDDCTGSLLNKATGKELPATVENEHVQAKSLQNPVDYDSSDDDDEIVSKEPANESRYRSYDKRNRLVRGFDKELLEILLDNPDCKRIIESGMSRKEKSKATVFCRECNKSCGFRYYVRVHALTHVGNLPFKCELCKFRVPKKYLLDRHMRIHSQTRDFLCTQCGKAFTGKHSLKSHMVKHSNDRPFKCNICEKTFKRSYTLQSHEKGHQDIREFVCDECGKTFKQKIDLQNHKALHTNEKNFECTTCGKKFLLKKGLNAHLKKHLDVKPYVCNICGKRFTAKSTWRAHSRIHTGEKPFACKVCGKTFRQRECIRRHMLTHTGETPYPCQFCPEKFKYSQQFLNHMKKHGENKIAHETKEDTTGLET